MASIATTFAATGFGAAVTIIIVKEAARWGIVIEADETAAIGTVLTSLFHYVSLWVPVKAPIVKENTDA